MQSIFAGAFLQLRKLSHDIHSQFADQHFCFSSSLAVSCHHRQWHWFAYTSIAFQRLSLTLSVDFFSSFISLFSCLLFLVSFFFVFSILFLFSLPCFCIFHLLSGSHAEVDVFFFRIRRFFATTLTYTISHPRAMHTVVSRPMCVRQQH